MNTILADLFRKDDFRDKVQKRLPLLLYLAEQKYRKAKKLNSAEAFVTEKIIIAVLKAELGEQCTVLPLAEGIQKADVQVDNLLLSIKTIQDHNLIRIYWASDQKSMHNFVPNYDPDVDWLLVNIFWGKSEGGLYYIPTNTLHIPIFWTLPEEKTNYDP